MFTNNIVDFGKYVIRNYRKFTFPLVQNVNGLQDKHIQYFKACISLRDVLP